MEGHRYTDDEPGWYAGPGRYAGPDLPGGQPFAERGQNPGPGVHERPDGVFRLPEQRPASPGYPLTDPLDSVGGFGVPGGYDPVRGPVRGPEYPTVRPAADAENGEESNVGLAEPTTLVPPVVGERSDQPRSGAGLYGIRRPIASVAAAAVLVILLIPVLRLLFSATFTGTPTARDVVPAVLLTFGLTLTGVGLFALADGRPLTRDAWSRPPVAYLSAGLIVLLAAGLAVA